MDSQIRTDGLYFLKRNSLFGPLGEDVLTELVSSLKLVQAEKGDMVLRADEPGDCMYLVVDGEVRVVHHRGGRDIALATLKGGELTYENNGHTQDNISGNATLVGSSAPTEFLGGSGSTVMKGGSGHDTFVGGAGHDTMAAIGSHNVFEVLASQQGGQHLVTNFVSGDQVYVEGYSLS